MTKDKIIEKISHIVGNVSLAQARACYDATFQVITKCLIAGEDVSVIKFGTFKISFRKARQGLNPQTGEKLQIPACKAPVFKSSKSLKLLVNNKK